MKRAHYVLSAGILATLLPLAAQAHPGHEAHGSFALGAMHPLTGWDHLAVLMCLGLLVADRGMRFASASGAMLALALAGGAALGLMFPQAHFVEPAILFTVLASAALLLFRRQLDRASLLAVCLAFTLVHGMAHGQESPQGNVMAYFAGFVLSGTALFAAGAWLAGARSRVRAID